MQPPFGTITPTGSGPSRRPFTLTNSSRDYGRDPRAIAYAAWYETPNTHFYHQYIYHTGVAAATFGLGKGVAFSHWNGTSPEVAIVDGALHAVVVAGIWSYGNPSVVNDAAIDSLAVYNPWNQAWGSYLGGAYYTRVSYSSWTTSSGWWGKTYNSNGGADPDPIIGIYQAGPGTSNPNAKHWIGYYVSIQRDDSASDNANYCHNENGQVMQGP